MLLSRLKIKHLFVLLIVVPIAFELIVLCFLNGVRNQTEEFARESKRAVTIASKVNRVMRLFYDGASILFEHGDQPPAADAIAALDFNNGIETEVSELETLTLPGSEARKGVVRVHKLIRYGRRAMEVSVRKDLDNLPDEFDGTNGRANQIMGRILKELSAIEEIATTDLQNLEHTKSQWQARQDALLPLGAAGGIAFSLFTALVYYAIVRRLDVIAQNAQRLAGNQELLPRLSGTDEIAAVDASFHNMALQLEKAARKERAMLDNAVDLICGIDQSLRFTQLSSSSYDVLGGFDNDLLAMSILNLIPAEERWVVEEAFEQCRSIGSMLELETRLTQLGGKECIARIAGTWSHEDKQFFCIIRDITREREISELRREFAAMISHDLKTPLTSQKFFLEMVACAGPNESASSYSGKARILESDLDRLLHLLNSLLDIERMEYGKLAVLLDKVSLSDVVERSLAAVSGLCAARHITYQSNVPETAYVKADSDRLIQVFVNLLSNAVKYSPKKGNIDVCATVGDGIWEVEIKDQAGGVPEELRDQLFERFIQGKNTEDVKSSGLGLYICKSLIEAQNGTIGYRPIEGGSSFFVRIAAIDN